MRNGAAVSVWLLFFQTSIKFSESSSSRLAEINSKSRSSRRPVNIQRVTRNEEILTRQNNQPTDHGKDLVTNTKDANESFQSFIATIGDFSEPKVESLNATALPTIEEEISPINLAALNKVEQLAFPLDVDISSLPVSDPIGTSSFLNILDESESNSDTENSTHQLGDSLIDPKIIESEPFLTILVNSPPQVVTEPSEPDFSPASPSDSVNVPLSYLHLRVPIPPSASAIAIAPLSLLPYKPISPIPSSLVVAPENVEISSSAAKSMTHSWASPEKIPKSANLTVLPLNTSTSVIIDLKSHSGQQVLTHNSDRQQTFYQVLPPLLGVIYRVAPQTWIAPPSLNQEFQFDQSNKFNLATSYGIPHAGHPLYGNNHRQKFGLPPTLRALGFPPISSTRDNLRHEVNWARVGQTFRSTNFD